MRRTAFVATAVALIGAGTVTALSARDSERSLPAVTTAEPARTYRVVYEVVGDSVTTTEERAVARPFDSDIVVRDGDGLVTAERSSRAGLVATRSAGADWVLIDVPFSPATGDTRLDRFGSSAAEDRGRDSVGGRSCRVLRTSFGREAVADVDRCVDAAGIVLRETWLAGDGEVLQTMTAVELELGGVDLGPRPTGTRLPDAEGNGAVRAVDDDEPIPFVDSFALDPGGDWDHRGRFVVVPPVLDQADGGTLPSAGTALVSDVWIRGADLLVLDQGASKTGGLPFAPRAGEAVRVLDDLAIGGARMTVDDRLAAVNVALRDNGFVRLSGTIDPDALRALAQTIVPTGGA